VIAAAVVTFLVVFALLAVQLRAGHDPALGNQAAVRPTVIERQVHRKVIVTRVVRVGDDGAPAQVTTSTTSVPTSGPAPVATPAPVTTRTS
jgi:hypothetical protein